MVIMGWGKPLGSLENNMVLGKYKLEVGVNKRCLNCLNGIELGNEARMNFFE
jgi:hypothetical protein